MLYEQISASSTFVVPIEASLFYFAGFIYYSALNKECSSVILFIVTALYVYYAIWYISELDTIHNLTLVLSKVNCNKAKTIRQAYCKLVLKYETLPGFIIIKSACFNCKFGHLILINNIFKAFTIGYSQIFELECLGFATLI